MVEVEEVPTEPTQETKQEGISLLQFQEILQSLKEVQKGAFRTINDKVVNSLPLDMDIELSDCISKMEKLGNKYIESINKVIQTYGVIVKQDENNVGMMYFLPPEDKKNDEEYKASYMKEINTPIQFDVKEHLPLFTKQRFSESKIDLADAPNRQVFFQSVLK